ncbi:MAG: hypothetical protein FWD31_00845 [Planctomycetaceae bacterium]|nr:hypothetical protein [Planctomycetaceae bacterium]
MIQPDTIIRNEGIKILIEHLGLLEAERFIMLMKKEPFDYTVWQENLLEDLSIEEISKRAADLRKNRQLI